MSMPHNMNKPRNEDMLRSESGFVSAGRRRRMGVCAGERNFPDHRDSEQSESKRLKESRSRALIVAARACSTRITACLSRILNRLVPGVFQARAITCHG